MDERYEPKMCYDYTQYSHDNDVNVIPEKDYKRLVSDTFNTICDTLRQTYGPYGSSVIITSQNETVVTKDGYNTFEAITFSHNYKKLVYLAIQEIITRVNEVVGDGTTTCILLAEKMFKYLKDIAKTTDDERNIKKILENIEHELQKINVIDDDIKSGKINKLTKDTMYNIIKLAANYDETLTSNLVGAMDPTVDENGFVTSVRNVCVQENCNIANLTDAEYEYEYLPGDYRVNINPENDTNATQYIIPETRRVMICDHTFGANDWAKFTNNGRIIRADMPVIIVAESISRDFMDKQYGPYMNGFASVGESVPIMFVSLARTGYTLSNEIKDLAAVLDIEPWTLDAFAPVDYDKYSKPYKFSIVKGNCLCFYDCKPATAHADALKRELAADLRQSDVKRRIWKDRISACLLKNGDTYFQLKTSNPLQAKLLKDKVTDCCSIITSAINNGVVPNMLHYGHDRMVKLSNAFEGNEFAQTVCGGITAAIEAMFDEIWHSKYGSTNDYTEDRKIDERDSIKESFYTSHNSDKSFDIVSEEMVDKSALPTSAQYDLEVIVAGISIVKYMLTSKSFIFESTLLKHHGDKGHIDPYSY